MKTLNQVTLWLLVFQLSGLAPLIAQPVLIQPNDPFSQRAPVGMGAENLRVSQQNADGTEALLTMDYTYDGFAGPNALILPVIGKRGQQGVGAWFGSDPVTVGPGRGTISVKVRYFNDEPGVPPMFTSDQVQIFILNRQGTARLFVVPFLKTIKWGSATAKPAPVASTPIISAVDTAQASKLAEEKRIAEEKARAEVEVREKAKIQAEAEAKAREDAEKRAKAEALAREDAQKKAEAEAARIAAEAKKAEEKQLAEQHAREEERQRAEAEQKRLAEEKRIAEEKARAESLAREEARKKAEAETKRLAEEKRLADERAKKEAEEKEKIRLAAEAKAREEARLRAEAETKRLAEERRVAEEKAKTEALAREAAQKKAEEDALRLAQERKIAEEKARAEALAREEAQRKAESEAKRLAEEKKIAEEKALAEAKARQEAEEKARQEALAQAKAEAEAKRLAEEKKQAEALAQAATAPVAKEPAPSFDLAPGMKTKITNVDVVNRSMDRTQMTFGVEFEYRDQISQPVVGVAVFRNAQPEVSRYFVSGSSEIGKSRRNFALLPVKFQPPVGLPDSAAFSTDKVLVYLQERSSGKRFNIFPATMLLVWRAAGSQLAASQSSGNSIEIEDFKQNDASSGYVSVKYHLLSGRGRIRAKIYEAKRPESAAYFTSEIRDVQNGRGLQLVDVKVAENAVLQVINADTVEVELLDLEGKVVAKTSKQAAMVWSKAK